MLFLVAYNSCKDNTKVQINRFLFPFFTEKQQTQTQKKQKEPEIEFYLWLLP